MAARCYRYDWQADRVTSIRRKTITTSDTSMTAAVYCRGVATRHLLGSICHSPRYAEVLRVVIEGGGYVGFVDIARDTTLAALRALIATNLDAETIPAHYQFVRPDRMLVGVSKERGLFARDFLPCITLMPTPESPLAGELVVTSEALARSVRTYCPSAHTLRRRTPLAPPCAAPAVVVLWTGAVFRMWVLPTATLEQLRVEASRAWGLNPADTLLTNADGAIWSDTHLVSEAIAASVQRTEDTAHATSSASRRRRGSATATRRPPFVLRMRDPVAERAIDPRAFMRRTGVGQVSRGRGDGARGARASAGS